MKRFLLFVTLAAIASGAAAPSAKRPAIVPPGVSIGGIKIGGLTAEQARSAVNWWYNRRVHFLYRGKRWSVRPAALGATVDLDDATERALKARPGRRLDLRVNVDQRQVRRYVRVLDARLSFPAEDATASLAGLRPVISPGKWGVKLNVAKTVQRIDTALAVAVRVRVRPAWKWVVPSVSRSKFGPVVVIHRGSNEMFVYNGERLWRTFPVATGQAIYPTPLGSWHIVDMQRNPWWRPPDSPWARGLQPIPPGPGNPLGTRWMGLDAAGVGMHGTPDAASIGYSASHGCIRMQIPDAEWLFSQVHIGTPVFIVSA
ncbi:MAG TPA: L,D-transpeptidase/peptidoglycan binding protein [Gaiellaceae bacterium]